jgi:hypothetical protein
MTDFERWLRAAMATAAEPPPAGLLDGIRRRHRRHVRRVGVACVAAVAVVGIAAPLVTRGILAGPAGTGPAGPAASSPPVTISSTVPTSPPARAPGTVLRDCQSNNNGTLGSNWKAYSVHAGPVWFIYARTKGNPPSGQRLTTGKLTASAMVIAISNGRTAVVTVASPAREGFRFLPSFHGNAAPYTLAEGARSLTLAGCPAGPAGTGIPESYAPGLTMFWQGYVTDLRGCIPLEVRTSPASPPIRVALPAAKGGCGS